MGQPFSDLKSAVRTKTRFRMQKKRSSKMQEKPSFKMFPFGQSPDTPEVIQAQEDLEQM
jgi:hypothetical protein